MFSLIFLYLEVYTCVAGFIEPGENLEDAARREVKGIFKFSFCVFSLFFCSPFDVIIYIYIYAYRYTSIYLFI